MFFSNTTCWFSKAFVYLLLQLAMGKMMEQGPVLIITFQAQLVMVIRNTKGEVVEGDPVSETRKTDTLPVFYFQPHEESNQLLQIAKRVKLYLWKYHKGPGDRLHQICAITSYK